VTKNGITFFSIGGIKNSGKKVALIFSFLRKNDENGDKQFIMLRQSSFNRPNKPKKLRNTVVFCLIVPQSQTPRCGCGYAAAAAAKDPTAGIFEILK
jgi:hypothetical protein